MTADELKNILDAHKKWLHCEEGGRRADLSRADLREALLCGADLSMTNLRGADLRGANLSQTKLHGADLSEAKLHGADLRGADLRGANLSQTCLPNSIDYLSNNFEKTARGYIVYKRFGINYSPPGAWRIEPGSVIDEVVDHDRCRDCACGVNVGTLEWVESHANADEGPIWKCLIEWEWLPGVCVPYDTDGKIRAERVRLLEIVS